MPSVQTKLKAVGNGGRDIQFEVDGKEQTADVSGSRTQVTIAGNKVDRKELKVGLACEVSYPGDKQEATAVVCK
jgi:hypothetical protein